MSLSVSNSFNKSLPTFDSAAKPLIKKDDTRSGDIQKAVFASVQKSGQKEVPQDVVTNEEKKFFATMFPENSSAIQSYTVYARSGLKNSPSLGTHFDSKG
jgi:hypothetical protein